MVEGSGSRHAIGEAYAQHRAAVYGFLLRRTHDVERAEDLTQDVFAAALRAGSRLDSTSRPVLAWLYAVAHRRFVDEVRATAVSRHALPLDAADEHETREESYGHGVARLLGDVIISLPTAHRALVVGRLLEGRSFAELAASLSVSENACKLRFERALRTIRGELEAAGVNL